MYDPSDPDFTPKDCGHSNGMNIKLGLALGLSREALSEDKDAPSIDEVWPLPKEWAEAVAEDAANIANRDHGIPAPNLLNGMLRLTHRLQEEGNPLANLAYVLLLGLVITDFNEQVKNDAMQRLMHKLLGEEKDGGEDATPARNH